MEFIGLIGIHSVNTKFKPPDINKQQPQSNGYVHISAYMETKWPISWRKRKCKKQQPKSKLSYQEAKTLIRNKRLADSKHRNGDYNPNKTRTGHCRLRSHMKKIGIEKSALASADWKHKPQPTSCSHALSTKEKEKAPGQQKVPQETNSMEQPPTYDWHCCSSPWRDYKYNKSTSNVEEEEFG